MENSDSLFLKKLKQKDERAFEVLFKKYYNDLLTFSSHYILDIDAAEDIVQDVFVKLYESDSWDINSSIRSYLFRAVKNRCLNFLRNQNIHDGHHQCLLEAQLWSGIGFIDDDNSIYKNEKALAFLYTVIQKLPDQNQKVIHLRIDKEYKFVQIAEALGISENNAKVLMSRSITLLRKEFGKLNINKWNIEGV